MQNYAYRGPARDDIVRDQLACGELNLQILKDRAAKKKMDKEAVERFSKLYTTLEHQGVPNLPEPWWK